MSLRPHGFRNLIDRCRFRATENIDQAAGGKHMEKVVISPKYQVVIPRRVRERLGLKPGQQVQVIPYENRIELIPLRPARELRGFLRGMNADFEREPDRL
jgi:AbrB family looped-hinge helix DNA binding protein